MREHIKAFLLTSSLAFGIPTLVEAEPLERPSGEPHEMRAETVSRAAAVLSPAQREKVLLFRSK